MKIASWNVNGLRAISRKSLRPADEAPLSFLDWLGGSGLDLLGLQEVRSPAEDLPEEIRAPAGWWTHVVAARKLGYSGVALFARQAPDALVVELGKDEFDAEGRFQLASWGALDVANVYFPAGHGPAYDNSRVPFKLAFYRKVHALLAQRVKAGRRVLVIGDFNTAHREIDLANPKGNKKSSGFLPEEREELDRWMGRGWVDTLRAFDDRPGVYSWWSQRTRARERNVGWRLDYVLASKKAMPFVRAAFVWPEVQGSDHCPVGVELDDAVRQP